MKKIIKLLLFVLFIFTNLVYSDEKVEEVWVQKYFKDQSNYRLLDIKIDSKDALILSAAIYDGHSQSSASNSVLAILKYDSTGTLLWRKDINSFLLRHNLSVDDEDNIYLVVVNQSYRFHVIKMDSQSNILWTYEYTEGFHHMPLNANFDECGNYLIMGVVERGYPDDFLNNYYIDLFSLNKDGENVWNHFYFFGHASYQGFSFLFPKDSLNLTIYSKQNKIVNYNYDFDINWEYNATKLNDIQVTQKAYYLQEVSTNFDDSLFINLEKLNDNGMLQWEIELHEKSHLNTVRMTIDYDSDIIVAYPAFNFREYYERWEVGSHNTIVAKYSNSGELVWEKRLVDDNFFSDIPLYLNADKKNNIFICEKKENLSSNPFDLNDIYMVKIDSSGNIIWDYTYQGFNRFNDIAKKVLIDSHNNIIIGGDSFLDDDLSEIVLIKLKSVTIEEKPEIPEVAELYQNFPNPFNQATRINYLLAEDSFVQLFLYDVTGKEIKKLISEYKNAGEYSVYFNASDIASGIYFYKIKAGPLEKSRKMILLR